MEDSEVGHAVLQVPHVTEEVLGSFSGGPNCLWGSYCGALIAVIGGRGGGRCRRWWRGMSSDEGWNHNEEQEDCEREYDEQIWIEAHEGVDTEKR